jgi:lipid A 3-O-deacylase
MRSALILPVVMLFATSPAHAGELFGGIYKHSVNTPLSLSGGDEKGVDLQLGHRWKGLGQTGLQPYVFGALNSAGDTSYAAAGLSYRVGSRVYLRPGIGLAIHNGSANDFDRPGNGEIEFGSRILFEPELGLGYQASERLSVEASWVHMSQGTLFSGQNPGIDNIGVRLNWRL